jgi:iron complex outermembrane receptor protein
MKFLLFVLIVFVDQLSFAQNKFVAKIIDASSKEPLIGATAVLKGTNLGSSSDGNGLVEIKNIPNGLYEIVFSFISYQTKTSAFIFPISNVDTIEVEVEPSETNLDEIVVTSTRSSRSIDDIPMRIESITAGELEEKAVMQPANIKMLLTESTGIQTQQTSATSASASIRIQGLDGKYTQMLKDGFPLYSGFASGLSILQIPPLDLKRVEVIKGSSSTLYGGGAIAGLINLITKVPTDKREISLLVNANQTKALDLNGYYSQKFKKWGVTFFASRNSQAAYDSNHDNFSDIPEFTHYTVNPKIFYYAKTSTISLGANTSFENRTGGDMNVIAGNGDAIHTYFQNNKSNRYSSQFKWEKRFENQSILTTKNSIGYFSRQIGLSDYNFSGNQLSSYSEISYLIPGDRSEWVSGLNLWTDQFTQTNNALLPLDYHLTTAGAFVQNNFKATEKMILETGLRLDYNSQHNAFALPRLSLMYKFTDKLTSRIGGGLGYKAPTLFSEEAETRSFRNIQPLDRNSVKAEKSVGGNFDINYKTAITDEMDISINQLLFYTVVDNPLVLSSTPLANGNYNFYKANGQLTSKGFETNLKISVDDLSLYIGYTYIDAKREFDNTSLFNPLTARHRINANVMYEIENKLRVAYELFYIGQQFLSTGELTKDYWVMGISVQRNFNKISLFVNAENFLDSRQSRFEPLYTGSIQNPQFRDIYSPTDGFIFNGGFKLSF